MKLLQINTQVNSGSTGRIAEDIGRVMIANGHESYIGYGRGKRPSQSQLLKIGNQQDIYLHGLKTLLTDRHGFGSRKATEALIKKIEQIQPDVIGLHNLHGYYLNIEVLFRYLKTIQIPVIWTLFDCWAFTGHCTYYDDIACEKWKTGCFECPKTKRYPKSYLFDNSKKNYLDKRALFTGLNNLRLVVHSQWLKSQVEDSFLSKIPISLIHSGVDVSLFRHQDSSLLRERLQIGSKKVALGVASTWDKRKGLEDFMQLRQQLDDSWHIILVGVSKQQIGQLPEGVTGITRTENVQELATFYSLAEVFVNPTWQDNFPTTNLEALACGTPIVTYNTGGSPEAIDEQTGFVLVKGDVKGIAAAAEKIAGLGKAAFTEKCRVRTLQYFNKEDRYADYLALYEKMLAHA